MELDANTLLIPLPTTSSLIKILLMVETHDSTIIFNYTIHNLVPIVYCICSSDCCNSIPKSRFDLYLEV